VLEAGRQVIAVPARVHLLDRALEQEADDFLLVAEVVMQVALADAAMLGDPVGRYRRRAALVEELQGGIDDAGLGIAGGHKSLDRIAQELA
jgi:hypothetical protein